MDGKIKMEQVIVLVIVVHEKIIGLTIQEKNGQLNVLFLGCNHKATLGAHIINNNVPGEYIVPACDSCNKSSTEFDLKGGIKLVSANRQKTCEK
jgi:hypothetical protein